VVERRALRERTTPLRMSGRRGRTFEHHHASIHGRVDRLASITAAATERSAGWRTAALTYWLRGQSIGRLLEHSYRRTATSSSHATFGRASRSLGHRFRVKLQARAKNWGKRFPSWVARSQLELERWDGHSTPMTEPNSNNRTGSLFGIASRLRVVHDLISASNRGSRTWNQGVESTSRTEHGLRS
jgi:hypothetical protein